MSASRASRRSALFDPADLDWRWDRVLREARQRRCPSSGGGQSLQERHGGASLRSARTSRIGSTIAKRAMHMTQSAADRELERLLEAFADAWNRHDVEALMSMMTEDGVFEPSAGRSVNGERNEGHRAVRAAYEAVFSQYPDAHWA